MSDVREMGPFARLFNNMREARSFPETDASTDALVKEQQELQDALADEFAHRNGLTRYKGFPDWWRILGRTLNTRPPEWNLPGDDHGELFARNGKPVLWVTHAYGPLTDARLRKMTEAADRYGLKFSIDAGSWYYPGATLLIVWSRKDDPFGSSVRTI